MSYRIAGIDVHKKMLAVVVSDVEIESEFHFERRMFGSNPEQLRSLAAWLLEQEVEEVVMESTAQYLETSVGSIGKVLEAATREAGRRKAKVRNVASRAGAIEPRATGTQEGFPGCRTLDEAAGGPRIGSELCA
jgi:hypothetical protein